MNNKFNVNVSVSYSIEFQSHFLVSCDTDIEQHIRHLLLFDNNDKILYLKLYHFSPYDFESFFPVHFSIKNINYIFRADNFQKEKWNIYSFKLENIPVSESEIHRDTQDNLIPKNIIQTSNDTTNPNIHTLYQYNQDLNSEFNYMFFNDEMCRDFIRKHFNMDVIISYDMIIPLAYKADLFRLCALYYYGGYYCDHKQVHIVPFREYNMNQEYILCFDRACIGKRSFYYNAFMAFQKNSTILLNLISIFIQMCSQKYLHPYEDKNAEWGPNMWIPALQFGPGLLKLYFDTNKDIYKETQLELDECNRFKARDIHGRCMFYGRYSSYYDEKQKESNDTIYKYLRDYYSMHMNDIVYHQKMFMFQECVVSYILFHKNIVVADFDVSKFENKYIISFGLENYTDAFDAYVKIILNSDNKTYYLLVNMDRLAVKPFQKNNMYIYTFTLEM